MRPFVSVAIVVVIGLIVWLAWAGQQRTPDRFLDEVISRQTLRVGFDPTYPPFESLSNGQPQGRDVDLARAIGSDLGVEVEFKALALDTLYDAMSAGQVDMLVSALPFVYNRQKEVRYSVPYYQAGQVLVVRSGETGIKGVADLQNRRVGVELGSNADTEARRLARTSLPAMKLKSNYQSAADALAAVGRAEIDAAIVDNTSAQAHFFSHQGTLAVLSPPVTDEPFVVAMPVQAKGLAARVDATIERLRASGELARMMGYTGR